MSEYAVLNIEIIKGATYSWDLVINDDENNIIDLTEVSTYVGDIRKRQQSSEKYASFEFNTISEDEGKVNWYMSDEQTALLPLGTHFYEVFLELTNGEKIKLIAGEAKVK